MDTIEFPALWGLKINVSPIAFKLFGVSIYSYGVIISVAFFAAALLAIRDSRKFGIKSNSVIDIMLFVMPVSLICARLYYVLFNWSDFSSNLPRIFNLRTGGLAIYGGIIGGFIAVFVFCKIKKLNLLKVLDFFCVYLVLGQAIGRWGNFINQEAYGTNTYLPWGMTSEKIQANLNELSAQGINVNPAIPVHPTFLYESLWDLIIFIFLIWYRKRKKHHGEVFCLYMVLYGIGRCLIESLRIDSLMVGSVRVSQVLAILFVVLFGVAFVRFKLKNRPRI